jgi:surface polysaccharide O-acyltransferase-like enzyme
MSPYLSLKLKVISFISILAVIYWHSCMIPLPIEKFNNFYLFQNIITSSILRFCVPMFFAISGYLFFFKPFNYANQLKKRIRSVLIPYIIWSFIGALFIYTLLLVPTIRDKMNLKWQFTLYDFLKHISLNPIQYQFWFLRDLMLLAILSPIIYWINKNASLPFILMVTAIWFLVGDKSYVIRIDSLVFFTFGASLAINQSSIFKIKFSKLMVFISGSAWLIIGSIFGYIQTYNFQLNHLTYLLYPISIIAGVIFIWTFYDYLFTSRPIPKLMNSQLFESTFFIFCLHEPILTIIKKITMQYWGQTNWQIMLIYILNPFFVLIICIYTYKFLKTISPKLLIILLGNR